jgi:hypothetical protein
MRTNVDSTTPPRLLLDTNVFRHLAHGDLNADLPRIRRIASLSAPRIFWTTILVHDELMAHLTALERSSFGVFRASLEWLDELCGNSGIAEGYPGALRDIVFENPPPLGKSGRTATNIARRGILKCRTYEEIPTSLRSLLQKLSEDVATDRREWAEGRARNAEDVIKIGKRRSEPLPPTDYQAHVVDVTADALAEILLERHEHLFSAGAIPRTVADIKHHGREFIHYEAALFLKATHLRNGYNFFKHENDYYDHLLCSFPAAGFTLVTADKRLRSMLEYARCPSPRVLRLSEGLELAEHWIDQRLSNREHR